MFYKHIVQVNLSVSENFLVVYNLWNYIVRVNPSIASFFSCDCKVVKLVHSNNIRNDCKIKISKHVNTLKSIHTLEGYQYQNG